MTSCIASGWDTRSDSSAKGFTTSEVPLATAVLTRALKCKPSAGDMIKKLEE